MIHAAALLAILLGATTASAQEDDRLTDEEPAVETPPADASPTDASPTDAAPTDAAPTDAAPTDAAPAADDTEGGGGSLDDGAAEELDGSLVDPLGVTEMPPRNSILPEEWEPSPAPPPAPPPPPPPAPAPALEDLQLPAPSPAVPAVPEVPDVAPTEGASDDGPFARGGLGYYALWYGPEWVATISLGVVELSGAWFLIPSLPALMGPQFDAAEPDAAVLNDPRLDDVIGRPFTRAKAPVLALAGVGLGALALAGTVDGVVHQDFHHTHSLVLGGLTSVVGAQTTSNLLKIGVGRLRPDFRDRYARASCQGIVEDQGLYDCDDVAAQGGAIEEKDWNEAFKSFPSGHASASFAFATFLSMHIGAEYVWADDAGDLAPAIGTLLIGAMYSGAMWTAATRVADNRHHLEDVVVGAGIGTAWGAAGYLLHFDLDGNARWRGLQVGPGPGEAGLSLSGRF